MKHGDFLRIDFVGKVADTGQIFDFTVAEAAKKAGLLPRPPALVIIGAHFVLPGVEKQLLGMKNGEEKEFTIPPEEAFGPRNPRLLKILPMAAFLKEKVNPSPGAVVEIDGMQARVQSVSGGRIRVDFNHPLAGKRLHYKVKITEVIEDPREKVAALFTAYGLKLEPAVEGGVLTVQSKEPVPHEARKFIQEAVPKWVKEISTIRFPEK